MATFIGDDTGNRYDGLQSELNYFTAKGGNDTVYGGYIRDVVYLGAGDDYAGTDDGADFIDTDTGNDVVHSGAGDDLIYSYDGLGSDQKSLEGDIGDDIFVPGLGRETISGGFGEDWVDYTMSTHGVRVDLVAGKGTGGFAEGDSYSFVENVSGSFANDVLIGNGAYNWLFGYGGNDTIRGGAGGDSLDGGDGTDTLDYRTSDAGVRISLAKGTTFGGDAQGDSISRFENVDGSDFGDRLTGDAGANRLRGFDGRDRLAGGDGDDRLSGGAGNDRLTGGTGADVLNGGKGADVFIFHSTAESGPKLADRDAILDFHQGQHDKIDLSAIDADTAASGNQSFDFIGTAGFHGASGELRVAESGGDLRILGDVNGDKHSDFSILVADLGSLRADDFIL